MVECALFLCGQFQADEQQDRAGQTIENLVDTGTLQQVPGFIDHRGEQTLVDHANAEVDGGDQEGLGQRRFGGVDELGQEGHVKNYCLRVEDVGKKAFPERPPYAKLLFSSVEIAEKKVLPLSDQTAPAAQSQPNQVGGACHLQGAEGPGGLQQDDGNAKGRDRRVDKEAAADAGRTHGAVPPAAAGAVSDDQQGIDARGQREQGYRDEAGGKGVRIHDCSLIVLGWNIYSRYYTIFSTEGKTIYYTGAELPPGLIAD